MSLHRNRDSWRGITTRDVINHILECYPEAIEIFQLLDPIVRSLLKHESVSPQIDLQGVADRVDEYVGNLPEGDPRLSAE